MEGTIVKVHSNGYGFIRKRGATPDDMRVFFHVRQLDDSLEFSDRLLHLDVRFDLVQTDRSEQAYNVRAAY